MIRDYMSFIGIASFLSILSLVVSFSYHVTIHNLTDAFESIPGEDYTSLQSEYSSFYVISDIIQVVGMVCIFGVILIAVKLITKVRFNPLVLPFAIIMYFVGIFLAMIFANSHYYVLTMLQTYDATFQVNSFLSWVILRFPYFIAIIGAVFLILGYAKAPGSSNPGGGVALEVG